MPEFMFDGFICCYRACDFEDILIGCKGEEEFLCIQEKFCCAGNVDKFPVGMIKEDGAILKCGLPCCTYGLIMPKVLIKGGGKFLCMRGAASFPFDSELVPGPVCACLAFRLLPSPMGFMLPPTANAPGQEEMA